MPQLHEIIGKILSTGITQSALALELGTTQGKISDMLQGRSTWEKHWQIFLRLLPICLEKDLIGERELLGRRKQHGSPTDNRPDKTGKAKANQR